MVALVVALRLGSDSANARHVSREHGREQGQRFLDRDAVGCRDPIDGEPADSLEVRCQRAPVLRKLRLQRLVREEPLLLKPGQFYFLATLVGCVAFVVMSHHYGVDVEVAAYSAIAATMLLRVAALRFNWRTRALGGWRKPG